MLSDLSSSTPSLPEQAYQALAQGQYEDAATLYEQAIDENPEFKSNYWHLGLVLLLQGQETEAQTTWFVAMADADAEEIEELTTELVQVLDTEAEKRETASEEEYQIALALRQHIREIAPYNLDNLLRIVQLSLRLETFTCEDLITLNIIELLQGEDVAGAHPLLLLDTLQSVLEHDATHPLSLQFAEACIPHVEDSQALVELLICAAVKVGYSEGKVKAATLLADLALQIDAENLPALGHLSAFYQRSSNYDKGIEVAQRYYDLAQTLPGKVFGNYLVLRGLMISGGSWEKAKQTFQHHQTLLNSLIEQQPQDLDRSATLSLFTSTFFFPYLQDSLAKNRLFHNQVAELCQTNVQQYAGAETTERFYGRGKSAVSLIQQSQKPLKIGYLSWCLRQHSVGWLARWLFQHHDRENFQIYIYLANQSKEELFTQYWFANNADQVHYLGADGIEIAEQVYQDEVNVLIDLDSITLDTTCEVMSLKPAPVQATWLGWDASGIPAVDYYLADPYVLPEDAQAHYAEKIWRLPETYIAVDGFEVGVPTLRRDQLDIPNDAVIYLSAQKGHKRHPDTARLQMRILKEVPNSYFLIKGLAKEDLLKQAFNQLAEEEGVSCDRLRFLPEVSSEAVHRANLGIADVVLDTYPYNGATTTLETLWMGVPLVTRVGEHFSSRNSYTMMMNAGISEGIAHTDEEYVEWGVRLGKDANLRQQISWKLHQSRQSAPLWNAKKFTREMENAYKQMWANYVATH